jgi:hypothetical protein
VPTGTPTVVDKSYPNKPTHHPQHLLQTSHVGVEDGASFGVELGTDEGSSDGFEDGSSLGVELGIDEGSSDGFEDGFEDGSSLGVELGIDDGSSDGFEDGVLVVVQDGAVEGVVVGESLVDGLADFAVLADFTLRRFVLFHQY